MRGSPSSNTALYRLLADEETGADFQGDPANTYGKYFRDRFTDLDVPYPLTPGA